MPIILAQDMVCGVTYRGTEDGPAQLVGVNFTPLITVAFDPDLDFVPSADDLWLLQVSYDAWAFPLPDCTTFSPFDIVEVVES